MSELTMNPTTAGSQNAVAVSTIFLQQFSFYAFLERNKTIQMFISKTKKNADGNRVERTTPLPFFKFSDTPIWIANKLKDLCNSDTKMDSFKTLLLEKGADYSVGLTKPSEQYPTPQWILFRNGEGGLQATATLSYEDVIRAQYANEIKSGK